MTNTDGTPPADKPARSKKNATATEPANTAPAAETVAAPVAPVTTTVIETRTGIGRGILIGAIAASLVGGLAVGGGAGALIATVVGHHGRPDFSQAGPGGQFGPRGPNAEQGQNPPQNNENGGMPGQPPQGVPGTGQNSGMPGQPPQGGTGQGQNGSGSSPGSSTDGGPTTDGQN